MLRRVARMGIRDDPGRRGAAPTGGPLRAVVWVWHMALPVLAVWLLLAQPSLDLRWEHHPSHFWLVLGVAGVNVVVALRVLAAARDRSDVRLLLVGYAFLSAAGFLFLHALATPGVLLEGSNAGFDLATPVGLAVAAVFFGASSLELGSSMRRHVVDRSQAILWVALGAMVGWAILSLARVPPLDTPAGEQAEGALAWVAAAAIALYGLAAVRYALLHRRRPSVMLIAILTASVLLGEAMATMIFARNWQLSWWTWHLLMTAAFGFVAYSAYVQYRREGSSAGLFDAVATDETVARVREEYGSALETLTSALERSESGGLSPGEVELITAGLAARFNLTERQLEVLRRASLALAAERDQSRKLGALAQVGTEAQVSRDDEALLGRIVEIVGESFGTDVMRVVAKDGVADFSTGPWPDRGPVASFPIVSHEVGEARIEFRRPGGSFDERDRAVMATLAAETAIALENARLYRRLDTLFRRYMSPDVAESLISDPGRSALGGAVVEVTAVFADLRGFTTFSERSDPAEVVALLNRYFGLAVPTILGNGGTVVQFQGDALLAIFNAPSSQDDHRLRAVRAALGIQRAIDPIAGSAPDLPRFRIGVNTGPALVGNVGSDEFRSFNVMGDAVNVAARLEAIAEPGAVVIGESTYSGISDLAEVEPLGELTLKGKSRPVAAFVLRGVQDDGSRFPRRSVTGPS